MYFSRHHNTTAICETRIEGEMTRLIELNKFRQTGFVRAIISMLLIHFIISVKDYKLYLLLT